MKFSDQLQIRGNHENCLTEDFKAIYFRLMKDSELN